MNDTPPGLFHIHGKSTLFDRHDDWMKLGNWRQLSNRLFAGYLVSLSPDHRALLSRFSIQDLAFKVVGVGSVGTRCLVLLLTDAQEQPLFLQIKQAAPSVVAGFVPDGQSAYKHQGQRVVAGQRLMQTSSDRFLGTSTGPSQRHFYFRQLRDMKIGARIETFNADLLGRYARLCGHALARAHAKSGGRALEISAYMGKGSPFTHALMAYASAYANQVERDFSAFRAACRTGMLSAQTETDFAADLGL
jgi:uncharacterized protein (DUF2252 family)